MGQSQTKLYATCLEKTNCHINASDLKYLDNHLFELIC